jgi:fibronectin-binding autotransporter adhesin
MVRRDWYGGPVIRAVVVIALALAMLTGTGTAARAAASCNDTWNGASADWYSAGDWSAGVPTAASDVCVESGTVTLSDGDASPISVASLDIGGNSGAAAQMDVAIHDVVQSTTTTIGPKASLVLNGTYTGANAGNAALDGGTVDNQGTITMEGVGYSATLAGAVLNQGTIDVPYGTVAFGAGSNGGPGSLDNQGTIDIAPSGAQAAANPPVLQALADPVTDDTGGSIVNDGAFDVSGSNGVGGYTQGNGSETGNPVEIGQAASLAYTGTGASSVEVHSSLAMTGNLAAGQNLQVDIGTMVTEPSSFSSAGAITLNGNYYGGGGGPAGITVSSGTFTNTGTLLAESNDSAPSLTGSVVNDGQIIVTPATTVEVPSGSLTNAAAGTLVAQVSSSNYGRVQLDNGTTFTAGGTLTPSLQGGFVPTAGQSFNVVGLRGGTSAGTFATVATGFYATYSTTEGIDAVYGQAPSGGGGGGGGSSSSGGGGGGTSGESPCHATIGSITGGRGLVDVRLGCGAGPATATHYAVRVQVTERVTRAHGRGIRRETVTIASGKGTLRAGRSLSVALKLNRAGRLLLAQHRTIDARVRVSAGTAARRLTVRIRRVARARRR